MAGSSSKLAKSPSRGTSTTTTRYKRTRAAGSPLPGGLSPSRWYETDSQDVYQDVFAHVRFIKNRQVRRRYDLALYQQYYNNSLRTNFAAAGLFSSTFANLLTSYRRLAANVIKSCIDTATARVAKSKPRAFVLPKRGDYRLKRKARLLTQFLDGAMNASGFYAQSEDVFRDGGIYGDGNVGIFPLAGKVASQALKIDEVLIDAVDGMYNAPRDVFWEHPTPRSELLEKYPKFAEQIDAARMSWRGDMAFMGQQDLVNVVHGWRRLGPDGGPGKDTRRVLCIPNATLEDEPWKHPWHPVLRWHWTPPTYGPFGQGISVELEGMQGVITNTMRDIAESIRMFAVPRIWVSNASGISQHTINNQISVNKYSGDQPVFSTPQAMAADVYQYLQWIIDFCYKQLGLSQMTAQSEKPAGLNSGVAMRTYQDVETQRFAIVGQRWERFYMEAARLHIETAKLIFKEHGSLKVMGHSPRGVVEMIDWEDASLDDDEYDLQVWPTNMLPESPEGKLQAVEEYVNSGFMPRDVAIAQMRMPVLNDWIDQETAARDNIERCIASILDKGKYIDPEPISNIDLCVTLAQSALLIAQDEDVEAHKQELLQRFLNRALELQVKKNTPALPPGGPVVPPGGPAGPHPVGQAPALPPAPLAQAGAGAVPAAA